jgi:hypothetical protein
MLHEYPAREPHTRWFADARHDLFVHYDAAGRVAAIEFCYGKPDREHALRLARATAPRHTRIDDGEGRTGLPKMSPIHVSDGRFDLAALLATLAGLVAALPPADAAACTEFLAGQHAQASPADAPLGSVHNHENTE